MTWQLYKCDSFREYSKSFLVDSTVSNEVEELCTSTQGILNVEKNIGGGGYPYGQLSNRLFAGKFGKLIYGAKTLN